MPGSKGKVGIKAGAGVENWPAKEAPRQRRPARCLGAGRARLVGLAKEQLTGVGIRGMTGRVKAERPLEAGRSWGRLGLVGVLVLWLNAAVALAAEKAATLAQKQKEAEQTIELFKKTDPDLKKFFEQAVGYAVFPTVGKGGLGVGGARGTGLVYEKGKLIGEATLTQVTVGFQLGGQAYSELIFFETPEALEAFKASKFAMSAQVSAVAAAEGASRNAKYQLGVAVFTMAKGGLMYEASVGGQKFKFRPIAP